MARKRGGLAGFYDRNKGFLKKAVPVGLSFIPGVGIPLAAAAGAAMGADTEGKGYFSGFNVGGAIKGGLEGYGLGKGAQSVRGLLAPRTPNISGAMNRASGLIGQANEQIAANPAFGGMAGGAGAGGYGGVGSMPGIGFGLGGTSATTEPIAGLGRAAADRAFGDLGMSLGDVANAGKMAGAGSRMGFGQALLQPQVLGSAIQGGLSMLPSAQSEALNAQTRLAQQQFDEEKRRTQMEEERKRRIAEMLMPFMQKNFPQYVSGGR